MVFFPPCSSYFASRVNARKPSLRVNRRSVCPLHRGSHSIHHLKPLRFLYQLRSVISWTSCLSSWMEGFCPPSVHTPRLILFCLYDLDFKLWDILPPHCVQAPSLVEQQSKQYHWVDNMVGGWVPERSTRRRRGGEMLPEGAVAIGNLDLCQERGVNHLHVFKSCMNNSLWSPLPEQRQTIVVHTHLNAQCMGEKCTQIQLSRAHKPSLILCEKRSGGYTGIKPLSDLNQLRIRRDSSCSRDIISHIFQSWCILLGRGLCITRRRLHSTLSSDWGCRTTGG